jgi:hypothetical protein
MTKVKDAGKLSPLAKKAELTLRSVLDDMAIDFKAKGNKYTLTDLMKVTDRALKLEAIRLSVKSNDEGSFFTNPGSDDPDDDKGVDDE